MKLSREQVRHVAKLARLRLSEQEEERYVRQLGDILTYVETLQEVDVSHIVPTAHAADIPNLLREDVVHPSLPPEVAVQNAPDRAGASVAVPKIIE